MAPNRFTLRPTLLIMTEARPKHHAAARVVRQIQDGVDHWQKFLAEFKPQQAQDPMGGGWPGFPQHLAQPQTLGTQLVSIAE
jgi:hypothetical protein